MNINTFILSIVYTYFVCNYFIIISKIVNLCYYAPTILSNIFHSVSVCNKKNHKCGIIIRKVSSYCIIRAQLPSISKIYQQQYYMQVAQRNTLFKCKFSTSKSQCQLVWLVREDKPLASHVIWNIAALLLAVTLQLHVMHLQQIPHCIFQVSSHTTSQRSHYILRFQHYHISHLFDSFFKPWNSDSFF